jgi:integrase
VLAVLSGFCRFAIENELLEYNPATTVKKPGKVRAKDRYLTMDEIKTVHDIISESGTRLIYDAFMLALFTGQRIHQIATLKKSYIKNNWFEFPAEVMKSGKLHKVYICEQTARIIEQRERDGLTNEYIFAGKSAGHVHPDSLKRALARLMPLIEKAGVPKFSFHDLRRTLSTHFNRLGLKGLDKAVLGHSVSGVTDIFYNRFDLGDEIKRALTIWGEEVERTITGNKANIITIKPTYP